MKSKMTIPLTGMTQINLSMIIIMMNEKMAIAQTSITLIQIQQLKIKMMMNKRSIPHLRNSKPESNFAKPGLTKCVNI